MAVSLAHKLFTIDEYERLIEAGILAEDARVELIHGEIIEMAPINLPHAVCVAHLTRLFYEMAGQAKAGCVWIQNPIWLPGGSRPEPDAALLKWRDDLYRAKKPTPADVLLLVEVSDSTLDYDRNVKLPIYASGGIEEVWIVNLTGEMVEVYSRPVQGKYSYTRQVVNGQSLSLPGNLQGAIPVNEILS